MRERPKYIFYYYALNLITGEVKFFVYDSSITKTPETSIKYHRLKFLARTLRNKTNWRIIERGYALEEDIKSMRPHQPLTPKLNEDSLVYSSVLSSR
jgi:hypothetical protein